MKGGGSYTLLPTEDPSNRHININNSNSNMRFVNNQWSIRRQFILLFVGCALISLILILVITIANFQALSKSTSNVAEVSLENEIIENAKLTVNLTAQAIARRLQVVEQGIIAFLGLSIEQSLEPDYPFLDVPSYFDLTENSTADFTHSVYYLANSSLDNYEQMITSEMNFTINRSAHMDLFHAKLMEDNSDILDIITGFENGVYRRFPGKVVDQYRTFVPTMRPWYIAGKEAAQGEVTISDPYLDAFGKGWVVSGCRPIYDSGNLFRGVIAVDMSIGEIQNSVLNVTFLQDGYAFLVQSDNQKVVAHPYFLNKNLQTLPSLSELEPITGGDPNLWSELLSENTANVILLSINNTMVLLAYAPVPPRYTLFLKVSKDSAIAPALALQEGVYTTQTNVLTQTIATSVVTLLLVAVIIIFFADNISSRLVNLSKAAEMIFQNAADDGINLTKGVNAVSGAGKKKDEIYLLAKAFDDMVQKMRIEELAKNKKYEPNPFHGNRNPWSEYFASVNEAAQSSSARRSDAIDIKSPSNRNVNIIMGSPIRSPSSLQEDYPSWCPPPERSNVSAEVDPSTTDLGASLESSTMLTSGETPKDKTNVIKNDDDDEE